MDRRIVLFAYATNVSNIEPFRHSDMHYHYKFQVSYVYTAHSEKEHHLPGSWNKARIKYSS